MTNKFYILCSIIFTLFLQTSYSKNSSEFEINESQKLFFQATKLASKGHTQKAIQLYSEVVEFFPTSKVWTEACIKLSSLLLLEKCNLMNCYMKIQDKRRIS